MPVSVLHFTTKIFNLNWLASCMACLLTADQVCAQTHFDYHAVRGRNPSTSTHVRFEAETEFESV